MKNPIRYALSAFALTAALLVGSVALRPTWSPVSVAHAQGAQSTPTRAITVVGEGKVSISPDIARAQIGVEYVYAAESPEDGFDCSGLALYSWGSVGVELPRTAANQFRTSTEVTDELRAGDLVFFGDLRHVGIYTGQGTVVHSPRTGEVVIEVPYDPERWTLAARPA